MNIYIIYFIGAVVCFLLTILLARYYNNGKGIMYSAPKVVALISAVLFFIVGMVLINLSAKHYWTECLLEVFNNLTCALLGATFVFIYQNNLISIKKPHPFNKD